MFCIIIPLLSQAQLKHSETALIDYHVFDNGFAGVEKIVCDYVEYYLLTPVSIACDQFEALLEGHKQKEIIDASSIIVFL